MKLSNNDQLKNDQLKQERRQAREFCLQFFFHLQLPIFQDDLAHLKQVPDSQEILELMVEYKQASGKILNDEGNAYVLRVIMGTLKNYQDLIQLIENNLVNWKIERIAKVDLSILLLSLFELLHTPGVARAIVINEAVELAKKFGTENSPSFINGLLEKI